MGNSAVGCFCHNGGGLEEKRNNETGAETEWSRKMRGWRLEGSSPLKSANNGQMEHDALIRPVQTLTEPHKSQINTGLVSSYPHSIQQRP